MGPIIEMASVSINKTAARCVAALGMPWSARAPTSLGTLRKTRSHIEPGIWRGQAWHGRAGQAFELVESGVGTGPPPIPRRGPPRATNRMTRPPRRSPPQEAARGFWIRAWSHASLLFKEPAARMTQHDGWASSRVGWTIPATHAETNSPRIEHPIQTLTCFALVTRQSNRILCLSCDNCLLE